MKALKITAGILGILVLISVLSAILLITFVSPNRFKPLITEQVKKYTGRELLIDGDLSWTVFPYLGVKAGHLELANPTEFKQRTFVEIQSATVGIKVLPLLRSKLESSGITFKGVKLYLIKNENGKTNWEDFDKASSEKEENASAENTLSGTRRATMGVALAGVEIVDAQVSWVNEQTKQRFDIEKFNLRAKDISLTSSFPLTMQFNFAGQQPDINGQISLTSKMLLNVNAQNYRLHDAVLTAQINQQSKKIDLNLKGDAIVDVLQHTMMLDNLMVQMANLNAIGKIQITHLGKQANTIGSFQIQPFDLKQWLQTTDQDISVLQVVRNVSGNVDFTASGSSAFALDGNINIDELKAANLLLNHITIKTKLKDGILDFAPFSAALYQGSLGGNAKINLKASDPQYAIQAKFANVQAEPLLQDLLPSNKLKITGVANIDLLLTTAGKTPEERMKNLNGVSQLSFNNGVLRGVDIGYLLESANALANKQSLPKTNTNQTQFGSITAKAVITSGIIANDDFYLNAPQFEAHGKGRINLVKDTINYDLLASAKQEIGADNKKTGLGFAIPISIAGNLSNPSIRMNADTLMKTVAQEQLQKSKSQLQKLQDKYKDKIPAEAGAFINKLLGR